MEFGALYPLLHQTARYLVKENAATRSSLVSFHEASRRKLNTKVGVLEVLGQTAQICWSFGGRLVFKNPASSS